MLSKFITVCLVILGCVIAINMHATAGIVLSLISLYWLMKPAIVATPIVGTAASSADADTANLDLTNVDIESPYYADDYFNGINFKD